MVICKEIDYYLKYAEEHPKWINKKRKLLIENIVKPILKRDDVFFDEKTYRDCLQYCKSNYYELFPFQKFIYAFAFMYVDDIPVFSKFFIKEGRGNGKDGFIVPLVNFFQTPLYGVKNYHVEIVANSESQVKDTFKVAYDMLHDNQKFKGKFSVTKELITNLVTGSEMKYNTSNAKTKDGKRTGCLVLNEIHAYENYDQINVFESSFGKVKHSREFIITTDGYVRDGPLDEISAMCAEILETGENLLGYFPFICEIDDMKEVDDPEAWHKANPSMEYMPILANQIMHDYLEMKKIPSKRAEFITKRMDRSARKEEETVTTWQNVLRACYIGRTMEELEHKIPRIEAINLEKSERDKAIEAEKNARIKADDEIKANRAKTLDAVKTTTKEGTFVDALAVKELSEKMDGIDVKTENLGKKIAIFVDSVVKGSVSFNTSDYLKDGVKYAFTVTVSSAVNDTSCAQEISCKLNNTLIGQNGNYCKLSSTFCGRCSKGDTILVTSYKNGGEWSMFNTRLIFVPVD